MKKFLWLITLVLFPIFSSARTIKVEMNAAHGEVGGYDIAIKDKMAWRSLELHKEDAQKEWGQFRGVEQVFINSPTMSIFLKIDTNNGLPEDCAVATQVTVMLAPYIANIGDTIKLTGKLPACPMPVMYQYQAPPQPGIPRRYRRIFLEKPGPSTSTRRFYVPRTL